jgi:hypothetical protein
VGSPRPLGQHAEFCRVRADDSRGKAVTSAVPGEDARTGLSLAISAPRRGAQQAANPGNVVVHHFDGR